jgi:allophanate hydrolase subunit 2
MGGVFEATEPMRFALTGAPMRADLDGKAIAWNASHALAPGQRLTIGPATSGSYGYLSVAGGIATPPMMGSRAAHLMARIGHALRAGETLPVGPDPDPDRVPMIISPDPRCAGGTVRVVPGAQTDMFPPEERARFEATVFIRSPRGNRQGARFDFDGAPFAAEGQRTILSEMIVPGDIQLTGDGKPYVLLPECQTTGGYPRIGNVLPEDLPRVAQAAPGAELRFRFLTLDEARRTFVSEAERFKALKKNVHPLVRDPRGMQDLLGYQLISGAVTGTEPG